MEIIVSRHRVKKMRGTFPGHTGSIRAPQNSTESLHFKQIFEY